MRKRKKGKKRKKRGNDGEKLGKSHSHPFFTTTTHKPLTFTRPNHTTLRSQKQNHKRETNTSTPQQQGMIFQKIIDANYIMENQDITIATTQPLCSTSPSHYTASPTKPCLHRCNPSSADLSQTVDIRRTTHTSTQVSNLFSSIVTSPSFFVMPPHRLIIFISPTFA